MTHQIAIAIARHGLGLVVISVLLDQLGLLLPAVPSLVVGGALAAAGYEVTAP